MSELASEPKTIGPYHVLAVLGEGGMGTVYLAEQREPVRRRLAVKVVKLGMDSKAVLQRFEVERQALARMNHDHIARVFDAGTTERGQPYFAMEHVPGLPLTVHWDRHRLSIRERVELFRQACAGVQHAHQRGVIHRDLKPSNLLVAENQGTPVVKIIDFGLARATDHATLAQSLLTEHGHVLGTPAYMSPEQVDPTVADLDTRTDIYSLGVVLHELLVGEVPFPSDELRRVGMLEMQRRIREVEPPRPSARLASMPDAAAVAAVRRTSSSLLLRALRTDLDWIVLAAIDKDRNRRYESAAALATDLGRYLAHEPVLAGPPSAGYRLRKFARRYRGQVAAGVSLLATLVVGAIGTVLFALSAADSEALARQKIRDFDQLAAVQRLADANERSLYPPWPDRIDAMERWLRDDARPLVAMGPDLEATVRDLEANALPWSEADQRHDRETHPDADRLATVTRRVASLRCAQAVRDGSATAPVAALMPPLRDRSARALNAMAWARVAPSADERAIHGEEALGVACAEAGLRRIEAGDPSIERIALLDTLAWGLFAVGRDDEARARSAEAVRVAPEPNRDQARNWRGAMDRAIAAAGTELARAEAELAELRAAVEARRTWRFAEPSVEFLHGTLRDLLARIEAFRADPLAAVEERLAWARTIRGRSIDAVRARWDEAAIALATADGIVASRAYASEPPLELVPRIGLVPIGMNPATALWEFYDLRSAAADHVVPTALDYDAQGRLPLPDDAGIVFVLIPGGTFWMGTSREREDSPAEANVGRHGEWPGHEVRLVPFFLARHELTQAQWLRLGRGTNPSFYSPGRQVGSHRITLRHPVERVDWSMCDGLLRRAGLELPTEAQWEYACRAGSSSEWWPGDEPGALARHANVLDRTAAEGGTRSGDPAPFEDGHLVHAAVGSFTPNAFVLFDMHGNVWEWCRDRYTSYGASPRRGDGLRGDADGAGGRRVFRGGSFEAPAEAARSRRRAMNAPEIRNFDLGVRAARRLGSADEPGRSGR